MRCRRSATTKSVHGLIAAVPVSNGLKAERLVLDWRKKAQARGSVRQTIEIVLDELPEVYDEAIYTSKCEATYRHVYDCYYGGDQSAYSAAVH